MIVLKKTQSLKILAILFLIFFLNQLKDIGSLEKPKVNMQQKAFNIDANIIRVLDFGQHKVIADFLWIITLMSSDLEHYKNKGEDLASWMYLRFKAISILDPLFKKNYVIGGRYLSIVKDDVHGGTELISKGLNYYPNEKKLIEMIAFNYTFELHDFDKGYFWYKKLRNFPQRPDFLDSLLIKINSQNNISLTETKKALIELLNSTSDQSESLKQRLIADIRNIQIEIDLKCLNDKLEEYCQEYSGKKYQKGKKGFVAPKNFRSYKLNLN